MKPLFTFLFFISSYSCALAQTVCGSIGENGTLTLTAPPGRIFNAIVFASYGTPTGSCGSFAIGGCHAANSATIAGAALIGLNSASVEATNVVFGDPCGGTPKLLAIEASYIVAVPLTLKSFSAKIGNDNKADLQWVTNDEVNTSHFVLERSADGRQFESIGNIPAKGKSVNNYDFTTSIPLNASNNYYRLKMADIDGRFTYSKVVLLKNNVYAYGNISAFPNPVKDVLTLSGLESKGQIQIFDVKGKLMQRLSVNSQSLIIDMSKFTTGSYILQYRSDENFRTLKLIKE